MPGELLKYSGGILSSIFTQKKYCFVSSLRNLGHSHVSLLLTNAKQQKQVGFDALDTFELQCKKGKF